MPVPNPDNTQFELRELGKRMEEVAQRLERSTAEFDGKYVRKDIYDLQTKTLESIVANTAKTLAESVRATADNVAQDVKQTAALIKQEHDALMTRVAALEDDKKWLTRLILGFIVMGILGAVFVATKAAGAP